MSEQSKNQFENVFITKAPTHESLGAAISNEALNDMLREQNSGGDTVFITNADIVTSSGSHIEELSDELQGVQLTMLNPQSVEKVHKFLSERAGDSAQDPIEHIIFETPAITDKPMIVHAIPEELRPNTAILWRYTLIPHAARHDENRPDQINKSWQEMVDTRAEMANTVGLNIVIGEHQVDELKEMGVPEEKIAFIQNQVGWEISDQLRREYGETLRRQYLSDDEVGVLVVSRINEEKGLQWLPNFVSEIEEQLGQVHTEQYKRVRVKLLGGAKSEPEKLFMKKLFADLGYEGDEPGEVTKNGVTFEYGGQVDIGELERNYNSYDILLNPSPEESFGRVTVEAMEGGMTVIGNSECPATVNILNAAPVSVGAIADSPETAAHRLLKLMSTDSEMLDTLKENAAKWTNYKYTYVNAVDTLDKALKYKSSRHTKK